MIIRRFISNSTVFIASAFLISNSFGQTPAEFTVPDLNWEEWDVFAEDNNAKRNFLQTLTRDGGGEMWMDAAKVLDIDGDGDNDVYQGNEDGGFSILLNNDNNLTEIFTTTQQIIEVMRHLPTNPVHFRTVDVDCCVDGTQEVLSYSYSLDEGKLEFHIFRIEIIHPGVMDLYRNLPPTFFQVVSDETQLLNGPAGHIPFKTYATGRFGYATASTEGRDGDIWWKVYIKEEDHKLRMGWLKKEQVKTIYQR